MISEDVAIRLRRLLLREHHLSNKDKKQVIVSDYEQIKKNILWGRFASDFHLLRPEFKVPEASRTRPKKAKAFDAVIAHSNASDKGPSVILSTKSSIVVFTG
jgi:hypothetical protein